MATGAFDKLKQVKQNETPKQKIVPIKGRKRENESSYTLWLDKNLMKALKLKAVEENNNIKNIVQQAIREFLKIK